MKYLRYYLFLGGLLILASCAKNFEDINTNPNAPVDVQPSLLLRKVLFDYGEQMAYEGFVAGNLLGQLFTAIDFNLFDRHSLTEPQFGGKPWDILYVNLRDNQIILDKAISNPAFAIYEGPALILKSYMSGVLTDLYGDVPYTEALNGKTGILTPAYDQQEDIYLASGGLLNNLDLAIAAIENYSGVASLEGDILYNGDLNAWLQFAQSLKIKYLMRCSAVHDVAAELQAIYEEENFIDHTAANASFDFTATQPNNFRMATARVGDFNLFIMSKTVEEVLKDLNDPRIGVFFRPTANNPLAFQGLLNGPDPSQLSISVGDFSFAGTIFRERTGDLDANFLTSFEVYFLLAEAAEKGLINADAKALYELGVQQAFDYWLTEIPADYLNSEPAAYGQNGADPLEQILTQKWLANINNGYEGWIEYRRTGFPALKPISASLNNNLIPVRMPYPTSEDALNNTNFQEAAASTNGNSINAPVWWDVN